MQSAYIVNADMERGFSSNPFLASTLLPLNQRRPRVARGRSVSLCRRVGLLALSAVLERREARRRRAAAGRLRETRDCRLVLVRLRRVMPAARPRLPVLDLVLVVVAIVESRNVRGSRKRRAMGGPTLAHGVT